MASFLQAKQSYVALANLTKGLVRTSTPRMPPVTGYAGDTEFEEQVKIWEKWIQWEKEDPLVLKDEDLQAYRNRILFVYKHALMALRFWPKMWYDAAEFCYANEMEKDGDNFLIQGMEANPESCLLAFRRADRLEVASAADDSVKRGTIVRAPYNAVLEALYALRKKVEERGHRTIAQIQDSFAQQFAEESNEPSEDDEDEDMEASGSKKQHEAQEAAINAAKNDTASQIERIKKTISWAWIALMRAMRRIQGKGKAGDPNGGLRQIFADARKRGQLTGDLFVECGLMEYQCYRDPAGTKILEKAVKLYPDDENVALAYIKHLIDLNDMTNARAVFETVVSKFSQDPAKVHKAKPLYVFFHDYESRYGELGQISKLEKRMADLYPDDPTLSRFSHRFQSINAQGQKFDPTTVQLIISPSSQMKPKNGPSIAEPMASVPQSPAPGYLQFSNSPKRTIDQVESDNELQPPPRKVARGESPLKGAAGRRLEARRAPAGPTPLPNGVSFLLQILPSAAKSQSIQRFNNPELIKTLRGIDFKKVAPPLPPAQQQAGVPPQSAPIPPPSATRPNFPPPNMPPAGFPPYGMFGSYAHRCVIS
jgi:cleavage stimulation factor subunit 3